MLFLSRDYLLICRTDNNIKKPPRWGLQVCTAIWLLSIIVQSPLLYATGTLVEPTTTTSNNCTIILNSTQKFCMWTWSEEAHISWIPIQTIFVYIFPFLTIAISHFFIIRKLKDRIRRVEKTYKGYQSSALTSTARITTTSVIQSYSQQGESNKYLKEIKTAERNLKIIKLLVCIKACANGPNISPTSRQHLTNNVGDEHVAPVCAGKNVGQMLASCWPTILN